MRVVLQTYAFRPFWGGVQRSVELLYQGLDKSGVRVVVTTSSRVILDAQRKYWLSPRRGLGLRGLRLPFFDTGVNLCKRWLAFLPYLFYLLWIRPQIVHLNFLNVDAELALWARRFLGFKLITTCRGSDIHQHYRRSVARRAFRERVLRESDAVTVVSQELRACLQSLVSREVTVIPDTALPAPEARRPKTPLFIFAGRLEEQKDPLTLMRAFLALEHPKARVEFLGQGSLGKDLHQLRREHAIRHNIVLPGEVEPEAVRNRLSQATALILPSAYGEGCPNAILEAFSCGVPVIGSRVGGITELLGENERGLLFPAGDHLALKRCLERFCQQPSLVEELGTRARAYFQAHHHPDLIVGRYLDLYRQLIGWKR
jgi:glycosyltransferase involved in cell wall biosynthesis